MTIQTRGPVLATIAGFSAMILVLAGLMIGWKWIAQIDKEEPVMTTEVRVVEQDLITAIESIPNIENWCLEYETWDGESYNMDIDIGDEIIFFRRRESLADFFEDINSLRVFQK